MVKSRGISRWGQGDVGFESGLGFFFSLIHLVFSSGLSASSPSPEMPNIGDREESLETLGLAFLSKSHGNVPFCLNFPHLGKRHAEGWKGFEAED